MKQAIIEFFIKGWLKRKILAGLAVLAPIINANAEAIPDVAAWIIALLGFGVESFFSYLNRRRLEREAEAARLESVANLQG